MQCAIPPANAARTRGKPPRAIPFRIVIDTREQRPYLFSRIPADAWEVGQPARSDSAPPTLAIETTLGTLQTGDYSIEGHTRAVAVERKSKEDLFSTLSTGRDRFENELIRLNALPAVIHTSHEPLAVPSLAVVICECELSDIVNNPPAYSKMPPKSIIRSIIKYQTVFSRVHWWMVPGREVAEIVTFRLLDRWWRENFEKTKVTKKESGK